MSTPGSSKARKALEERKPRATAAVKRAAAEALGEVKVFDAGISQEDALELRHLYPASFFIPNIGQEKATLPLKDYTGGIVVGAFFGGNGVGKTTALAISLVGLCCGKMQVNRFYDDWKVFDWADGIRFVQRRALKVRLICHQTAMAEDGNLYQTLLHWFPKGWVTWHKQQKSYFCAAEVRNPADPSVLLATIQVRTFDQDTDAHRGDTLDVIFSDEPFPKKHYSENVGRLRRDGILWIFCTPLEVGGWMKDQLHGRHDVHFTQATIWDNCADWHPDPSLIGKTRGVLPKANIERQLKEWDLEGPEVRRARELGEFTHLAGQVLKEWNDAVHVCEPFQIPSSWPVYRVMDPSNGGKPDFVSWWAQSPDDELFCIAEYPSGRWIDETKKPGPSVRAACAEFREVEEHFREQVVYSHADPALWKFQQRSATLDTGISVTMASEFLREGFRFSAAQNDPKIGLTKLRELLYYDITKPVEKGNRPRLRVFRFNWWTGKPILNTSTAPGQWCFKKSVMGKGNETSFTSSVEDEWKDPVDCMRYLATCLRPFKAVERENRLAERREEVRISRSARW